MSISEQLLLIVIICSVVGFGLLAVLIYKSCSLYRKYALTRSQYGDHKNWRASYTPNLRGNLVKTYATPIENDFYLDTDQELGKGGCGVVVVGEHKETHAQYAIKIVDKRSAERGRLDRELKLLKDVDHTNIVRLFSVYDVPSNMYFVMELCLGGHLGNLLSRQPNKCVDELWAKKLCRQLLSAIVHIHGRGIAHRDIKLQNVLIDNNNDQMAQLKLIDFGYGSRYIGALPMRTKCGTPYTTAPEVIRESYDERCDVWSLGVVLYIMLSGKRPFEALEVAGPLQEAGKAAMITNILAGRYHFNHKTWQNVSKQGISFVKALLHPDYRHRLRSRDALDHPWLKIPDPNAKEDPLLRASSQHVLTSLKKVKNTSDIHKTGMMAIVFGMQAKMSTDLRAVFQSFDADASGCLSRQEFTTAMQQLSPELSLRDTKILFDSIDIDHNQQISYTEFLAATIDPRDIDLDELSKAFHLLDEDGNGFITKEELTNVLRVQLEQANNNIARLETKKSIRGSSSGAILKIGSPRTNGGGYLSQSPSSQSMLGKIQSRISGIPVVSVMGFSENGSDDGSDEEDDDSDTEHLAADMAFMPNKRMTSEELDLFIEEKVTQMFAQADVNGDGVISHAEFLWAMTGLDFYLEGEENGVQAGNGGDFDSSEKGSSTMKRTSFLSQVGSSRSSFAAPSRGDAPNSSVAGQTALRVQDASDPSTGPDGGQLGSDKSLWSVGTNQTGAVKGLHRLSSKDSTSFQNDLKQTNIGTKFPQNPSSGSKSSDGDDGVGKGGAVVGGGDAANGYAPLTSEALNNSAAVGGVGGPNNTRVPGAMQQFLATHSIDEQNVAVIRRNGYRPRAGIEMLNSGLIVDVTVDSQKLDAASNDCSIKDEGSPVPFESHLNADQQEKLLSQLGQPSSQQGLNLGPPLIVVSPTATSTTIAEEAAAAKVSSSSAGGAAAAALSIPTPSSRRGSLEPLQLNASDILQQRKRSRAGSLNQNAVAAAALSSALTAAGANAAAGETVERQESGMSCNSNKPQNSPLSLEKEGGKRDSGMVAAQTLSDEPAEMKEVIKAQTQAHQAGPSRMFFTSSSALSTTRVNQNNELNTGCNSADVSARSVSVYSSTNPATSSISNSVSNTSSRIGHLGPPMGSPSAGRRSSVDRQIAIEEEIMQVSPRPPSSQRKDRSDPPSGSSGRILTAMLRGASWRSKDSAIHPGGATQDIVTAGAAGDSSINSNSGTNTKSSLVAKILPGRFSRGNSFQAIPSTEPAK